jgi:hypothetical protein
MSNTPRDSTELISRHKDPYPDGSEKKEKVEHIAPRHAQKKTTEGDYKDRAALRRAGKDDEYKDVSSFSLETGLS